MGEPGVEQPVEDVLEDDLPVGELPNEANEADVVEQHIAVPVEDELYPG